MIDAIPRLNAALEGRYAIERELGQGGMATVYLADDLRHERKVALKVLKPELAAVVGAERFLAEIKTTANLQHPHILPLFDSGQADSFLFYVMPYIEGETLRDRIDREKQLPVDEALGIATAVAHALQTAHEAGVIHRDIKPGNILLSRGQPLVSDFGIALAVGTAGGGRLTETGLSVGTPFYMSPEQATGDQLVGPQTDTYALAAVLYEMLIGDPPYVGSTAQAVLGKIIQGQAVSATAARKTVPRNVDAAIRRGLERLPADRFTRADDFAKALADPSFRHGEADAATAVAHSAGWRRATFAASGAAVALAGVLAWSLLQPPPPPPLERYESPFRAGQEPVSFGSRQFALSPDGSMLAYLGPSDTGPTQIWIRRWSDAEAAPIRNTVGAGSVTFSPDGREVAFTRTSTGELFAVSLDGGPTRALGGGIMPYWGDDGYVYSHQPIFGDADAQRVLATGGPGETVSENRSEELEGRRFVAALLPGGRGALLNAQVVGGEDYEIHRLDLDTGESERLLAGRLATYVQTGHLLYVLDGTLLGVPFNARSMELEGPSVPLLEGVIHAETSHDGRLVYSAGFVSEGGADTELVWVTRDGTATPVEEGWVFDRGGTNPGWSLSPDGMRIALRRMTEGNNDIWVKELPAGPLRRLTFGEDAQWMPFWPPDGASVTYLSGASIQTLGVWSQRADGTGQPERILDPDPGFAQATWDPSGEWLVLRVGATAGAEAGIGGRDLLAFRPGVDTAPTPLVATAQYAEETPAISRDGRWLAYISNETGREEIFVRPFPNVDDGKWQVSSNGAAAPVWAHNGRELFYVDEALNMVSVRFEGAAGFRIVAQEALFTLPPSTYVVSTNSHTVDIDLDDERFLMGRRPGGSGTGEDGEGPSLIVVQNFFQELERLVPRD